MKPQQIVAIALLLSMMTNAGLQTNRAELLAELKNYSLLLRALLANFILVPLAAWAILAAFHVNDLVTTGILLMAIAPGVPFVVMAGGRAKGGSHELATALAFILPVLSFVTIPITAQLLLPANDRVNVPPGQLFSLLAFQIVPLVAGALIAARAPAFAAKLSPPLGRITFALFLLLMAILVPSIVRSVLLIFGSRGVLAVIAIDVFSLAAGWLLGGPRRDEKFTLAIGTALRNPAVALVIATERFPGPIVAASVTTYFLVQFAGATIFGGKALGIVAQRRAARS